MNHSDHVRLIQSGISKKGGVWADLGSGEGAFTLALRELAGPGVHIYSVDKDQNALELQKRNFIQQFPSTSIYYLAQDFLAPLPLPHLDGLIMANSLHFTKNQVEALLHVVQYLKPEGTLLLIEYNATISNTWVPYPVSFDMFQELASEVHLTPPQLLSTVPSRFLNEIYAARAHKLK